MVMDIYGVELCRRGRWELQDARFVAARDADEAAYKVTGEHLHSEGGRRKVMKSAAIVAAALALSATVMPAEPLPVVKPSGPPQGRARGDEQRHMCVEFHAQVRRLLRHRSARHNAHRSQETSDYGSQGPGLRLLFRLGGASSGPRERRPSAGSDRTGSGHAAAAPPSSVMNSRRCS